MKNIFGRTPAVCLLLAAACLSACALSRTAASQPATAEKAAAGPAAPAALLQAHNQWRAKVGISPLQWSQMIARRSQEWADHLAASGCMANHSDSQEYGENIYMASPTIWSDGKTEAQQVTPQQVVNEWGKDGANYDHASNSCADGMCGNYTQLVWRGSQEVGCGMAFCPDKSQIWVCNYYPAGNVIGERPY